MTQEMIEKFARAKGCSLFSAQKESELRILLTPKAKDSLSSFTNLIENWFAKKETLTVFELLEEVLSKTGILEKLEEEAKTDFESAQRLDNVQELLNAAEEFTEQSQDKSVRAYLEQVSLFTELDQWNEKKDAITLMTMHIAKGLEFPVVFLSGMEEGLFPLRDSLFSEKEMEEERRLCYVGMTRAQEHLFLTSAASRKLFGKSHWNSPSRFVQEAGLISQQRVSSLKFPLPLGKRVERSEGEGKGRVFRIGNRVSHPDFGKGKIMEISGEDENLKVVVAFDSGIWHKFLVKYASLRKL